MKQFGLTKWLLLSLSVLVIQHPIFPQRDTVKGKITNATTGEPLASVTTNGTDNSVITSTNREFSIEANDGDELTISSIRYEADTIKANGKVLSVGLKPSATQLSGVVVTALGVNMKPFITITKSKHRE